MSWFSIGNDNKKEIERKISDLESKKRSLESDLRRAESNRDDAKRDVRYYGEAEILNHNALANEFFALSVRYDNKHHKAEEKIPSSVKIVFGKYMWKYGHFVVLDKFKKVIFDSFGISNTVKNGKLESMRWYFNN